MPKDTFFNLPEEKRKRILHFAIEEFASNPYDVASISKIVRQAGIAKGSFYQYLHDKKDLYHFLIEIGSEEKLNLLKELPAPDPSSDLLGYMRWQFLSSIFFEIHHPLLARIAYRAFVEEVPFPAMTDELRRRGTTQFFKQLIAQGILHGDIAPWVDPGIAAFLMGAVFYQFGRYVTERLNLTKREPIDHSIFEDEDTQQLLSNLMDILEAGMKRDPQQRKVYFNKN